MSHDDDQEEGLLKKEQWIELRSSEYHFVCEASLREQVSIYGTSAQDWV